MNVTRVGRTLVTMIVVASVAVGCTPDADPGPTPTPPPSVSQAPTESAVQRQQRLDYAAAEKSYRAFRAEYNRVLRAGGAKEATAAMKATAGNGYLSDVQEVAAAYKGFGYRRQGKEVIASIKPGGYSRASLILIVCEDTRLVRTVDKAGKTIRSGELRLNSIEAELKTETWKLWSGTGKKVSSCE